MTRHAPPGPHSQPDGPVAAAIRAVTLDLALSAPNGPALWKRLERSARAALEALRRRGVITGFHVRCDEETNEGAGDEPVLEVRVRYPKRVREVVIRVAPSA